MPRAVPLYLTLPLAAPPPAAGSCITSLTIVVAFALGVTISIFPTPSPPLATGLPSVIVDGEPDEPNVTDLLVLLIVFWNVRVPPLAELMTVIGPVNVKEFGVAAPVN